MGYNLSVAQYGLQLEKITLKMNSRWRVIFGTVGRLVGTSMKEKAFHLKKKKKTIRRFYYSKGIIKSTSVMDFSSLYMQPYHESI